MKKYKIKFLTFNMVGLPGETLKNAFETVYLNVKIKTNYPWCSIFTPYPGTELRDYALREGLLNENFDPDFLPESFHRTSILNQKNRDALINLHKLFSVAVHFPWTIPIIKKLIKLKPNKLYYLIFGFFYVYDYIREQNLSIARTIILTLRSFNIYMKKG